MNSYMKRALAQLLEDVKDSNVGTAQKVATLNLAWSFYEFLQDVDEDDIDISEEEAEEILSSLPAEMEDFK